MSLFKPVPSPVFTNYRDVNAVSSVSTCTGKSKLVHMHCKYAQNRGRALFLSTLQILRKNEVFVWCTLAAVNNTD